MRLTKTERRALLIAAQEASTRGDITKAQELFALVGISYVPHVAN